jgi:hypothetical protein
MKINGRNYSWHSTQDLHGARMYARIKRKLGYSVRIIKSKTRAGYAVWISKNS